MMGNTAHRNAMTSWYFLRCRATSTDPPDDFYELTPEDVAAAMQANEAKKKVRAAMGLGGRYGV